MLRTTDAFTVELSAGEIATLARAVRNIARMENVPARESAAGAIIAEIVADNPELAEVELLRLFLT